MSRFLDLKALASVVHLRFTTRHRIQGSYSGRHRSRVLGGSGEFVDYREYSPGEDLRRLDWKVLARTGKAYLRQYQEETNLLCTLAIDVSRSMQFGADETSGSGSKAEHAQYLATALSHVISQGHDQVGVALLADSLLEYVPPGGTLTHVARVQEIVETLSMQPTTRLAPGLQKLFLRSPSRGVLLLMSDFLVDDLADVFASLRLFRHRQWEVVVLHVVHPDEEHLPGGTAYRLEGLENDGSVDCSPEGIRTEYERRFREHLAVIRTFAMADGCDYRRVSTAISYLATLGGFLVERTG